MPIEPLPTAFAFPDPGVVPSGEDLVAVGGDLRPGTVLAAYRSGMFPMHLPDGLLGWWSPQRRGILPFSNLVITRSLARSCRRFEVSVDVDCEAVIAACADPARPQGWITEEMAAAYLELHRLSWVHSFEVWDADGALAGGLYGVGIGGLFCGESMFHRVADASKVAVVHLVSMMSEGGGQMLDVQWLTPHLERMGAVAIDRSDYLGRLHEAVAAPDLFE